MTWSRLLATSLVLAVVLSSVVGLVGTASADQDLAVTSVDVTPAEPAPGERITVTTTIENLQSSSETVQVTDVYVRVRGEGELARAEDLGSIGVGSSMTVPLSMTFDSPGEKDLRIHVVARDSEGHQRIEYPAFLTVSTTDDVNLAIASADFVAGERASVNVTVANGGSAPISNVQLELGGDGRVDSPKRVSGTIPAETDREYTYAVRFDDAGTGTLEASLRYAVEGGVTRTATESTEVTVDPAGATTEGRIRLTGVETTVGTTITVSGEAANVGTTDAQSVLLSVQETDDVTPVPPSRDFFVGTVEGSEFGTFELTASASPSATSIPVLVEWTVGDERRSEVVPVDIGSGGRPAGDGQFEESTPEGGSGGPPGGGPLGTLAGINGGVLAGTLFAVIGIPGLAYYLWKRQ